MDRYDLFDMGKGYMSKLRHGAWVKFEDIPTWIEVSVLPKESCYILVFRDCGSFKEKEVAYYDADEKKFHDEETGANITDSITHYQYLPEDP